MKVVAMDVKSAPSRFVDTLFSDRQLPRLISESDFVVLTVPFSPATDKLIGEKELRAMKRSAYLINVSRGAVVDEPALIRALEERWIAGAGLDVFVNEPIPQGSRLWELPNVIISPHVAGVMAGYNTLATKLFCENLKRYVEGKRLFNIVNKRKGF